ncbi:MAG: rhodanese-like domain-containing protein [Anaerolineales bacterium]|nr:rhodanese-like domain-containing protein [Anaerolineales bacterium]
MPRKRKDHHRSRRSHKDRSRGNSLTSALRKPGTQIAFLLVIALVVFLILQVGGGDASKTISVSDAYKAYQNGAFILDVRTPEEWNEYRVPDTTFIPLEQLPSRLGEIPRDRQIIVVCRTGNRSQQGRNILLNAGFEQVTSMSGGLNKWRASGYPIEP